MSFVQPEYVPRRQAVNQEYYKSVLACLCENVQKERLAFWQDKSWILHHGNAPAHAALSIWECLAKF